ncbi:tyrosine-type recombinase/integrase [Kordiimonas sp. SCSIO 12603]|uniref:tyrosine-type recombinase/integrase n=1 Tax=Kordiimonas sp. SCSIO 12603 TaxID=2829596 RepID=UPI002106ED57|nr:tyrosine-type recombinase/integrase [Kordiimonas sp. SCSIO 12603]UTW58853.1 tyrosine-type recombinase/integrase [Kordiimonas sp. SCSIO 12603]
MKNTYSLYNAQGKRLYLTLDERKAFFEASKHRPDKVRTLCQLLYYTGCRVSEALNLTADRVDMAGGEIVIQSLKKRSTTPHYRPIPVPMAFLEELAIVHGLKSDTDHKLWSWSRSHTWRLIKATMDQANINTQMPYGTCKGLRHSFGIHAVTHNVPLNIVQSMLGHANMSTTAIYVDAVGDERRELVSRMWSQ